MEVILCIKVRGLKVNPLGGYFHTLICFLKEESKRYRCNWYVRLTLGMLCECAMHTDASKHIKIKKTRKIALGGNVGVEGVWGRTVSLWVCRV